MRSNNSYISSLHHSHFLQLQHTLIKLYYGENVSWSCIRSKASPLSFSAVGVEPEMLHTYSKFFKFDVVLLIVRLAVLAAVTLTVPVVLFPVSAEEIERMLDFYCPANLFVHVGCLSL